MNKQERRVTHPSVLGTIVLLSVVLFGIGSYCVAQTPNDVSDGQVSIQSPDGTIQMMIRGNGPLTYSVSVDGKPVLAASRLGLKFKDGVTLGADARLVKVERSRVDTSWENQLGKRRTVHDCHNELRVFFVEKSGRPFEIVVRAFDDGIGFRYVLPAAPSAAAQDFVLEEELTEFSFPENYPCYAGENENTGKKDNPIGYVGSQESEYKPMHSGGPSDRPGPDAAAVGQDPGGLGTADRERPLRLGGPLGESHRRTRQHGRCRSCLSAFAPDGWSGFGQVHLPAPVTMAHIRDCTSAGPTR